jgi:hypothetical protein
VPSVCPVCAQFKEVCRAETHQAEYRSPSDTRCRVLRIGLRATGFWYPGVAPSSRKTFALRYRINGSQRQFRIGLFGPLTTEDARRRAKQLLGESPGGDPSRSRKATRDDPTIRVLSKRYIEEYAEKQKKTVDEDQAKLDRYVLPRLGSLRVSAIRRRDVIDLHREISRKYPIGANRVLALVSKMFSLAVLWTKPESITQRKSAGCSLSTPICVVGFGFSGRPKAVRTLPNY